MGLVLFCGKRNSDNQKQTIVTLFSVGGEIWYKVLECDHGGKSDESICNRCGN